MYELFVVAEILDNLEMSKKKIMEQEQESVLPSVRQGRSRQPRKRYSTAPHLRTSTACSCEDTVVSHTGSSVYTAANTYDLTGVSSTHTTSGSPKRHRKNRKKRDGMRLDAIDYSGHGKMKMLSPSGAASVTSIWSVASSHAPGPTNHDYDKEYEYLLRAGKLDPKRSSKFRARGVAPSSSYACVNNPKPRDLLTAMVNKLRHLAPVHGVFENEMANLAGRGANALGASSFLKLTHERRRPLT